MADEDGQGHVDDPQQETPALQEMRLSLVLLVSLAASAFVLRHSGPEGKR